MGLCETALHRKDYEEVKEFARKALYWQKQARAVLDSIQSSEARAQMNEFDTELAISYAENETKEQELEKEHILIWAIVIIAAIIMK